MKIFENETELSEARLKTDQLVRTKGKTSAGDGLGGTFRIEASGASGVTIANGNVAVLQGQDFESLSIQGKEVPSTDSVNQKNTEQDARLATNESNISALQSGQGSGVYGYATKSLMDADLTPPDQAIAYVTNDTTTTNNGTYRKSGASGSGSWIQSSSDLASQAYQQATDNKSTLDSINGIQYRTNRDNIEPGLVQYTDGAIFTPNGTWFYNLRQVAGGEIVTVKGATLSGLAGHAWYDEDMQFISGIQVSDGEFTLPPEARYLGVSCRNLETTLSSFDVKLNGKYNIELLKESLTKHPAITNTDLVTALTTSDPTATLTALLDKMLATSEAIAETARNNANKIDEITDESSPIFIDPTEFFHGAVSRSAEGEGTATPTRISNNSFSLSSTDASELAAVLNQGIAVSGGDYVNTTVQVTGIETNGSTTTYTTLQTLPDPLVQVSAIGQGGNGQHLSRIAQKAYAEMVADAIDRYNYRKDALIDYNPSYLKRINFNDPSAYSRINDELLYEWVKIGGATGGGLVDGTTDLARSISITNDVNMSSEPYARPLGSCHLLRQGVAGQGLEYNKRLGVVSGFFEATFAAEAVSYDSGQVTSGSGTLVVIADGIEVSRVTVTPPEYKKIHVDINAVNELKVQWFIDNSVPTSLSLGSMAFYTKNENQTPDRIISSSDVVAVFADSWGTFPNLEVGEDSALRPDGTPLGGLGYMSEHMRDYLANKNINITAPNMSRGGQTSEWARFWVESIANLSPRPTHCIVHFSINDNNSADEYESGAPSGYDFDPENQWGQLDSDQGGIFGSVNNKRWFDNMKYISDYLLKSGIKPIIILPPYTSSLGQSQAIQRYFKAPMYSGFKDNYWTYSGIRNTPDK
ncbi:SGNH hydrolase-type esterase domain protein [Vibrio phage 1.170.O._10N.261.52.C3]|nr:SGNH hydrolase-type esterase domain protein [Vibrio phage 1.170.O._10N.261.52.C3]